MSSIDWLITYRWAILFYLIVGIIVFLNRQKFEKQGIIYLLRTKLGLRMMDQIALKHKQIVRILGISAVGFAFMGMATIIILLIEFISKYFTTELKTVGISPVVPGFPIAGTGLVFPLVLGWICLFIVMVIHEFSHGIVARAYQIPVRSSGLVFIGPVLGAFVEPDEKQMSKRPQHEQLAVFAAGPVSNIAFAVLLVIISSFILSPLLSAMTYSDGIKIVVNPDTPAKEAGLKTGDIIYEINGVKASNTTYFDAAAAQLRPGDNVKLVTSSGNFMLVAATHPQIPIKGYIGISRTENRVPYVQYSFIHSFLLWLQSELIFWLNFVNVAIGLINLLPIYITDGARMVKIAFENAFAKEKARRYWVFANNMCLLMLFLMIAIPLGKMILSA